MKRLSFTLGLIVVLTGAHPPLVAKIVLKKPKLLQAKPQNLGQYAHDGKLKKVKEAVEKWGADVNADYWWEKFSPYLGIGRGGKHGSISGSRLTRQFRGSPLHAAAMAKHEEVAEYLIAKGANVNAKALGSTPLHVAAWSGSKDIVALLITKGADVNAKREDGWTPLHAAAKNGNKYVTALLIAKGANVNARTRTKFHRKSKIKVFTPLGTLARAAAEKPLSPHYKETALLLLQAGANPYIRVKSAYPRPFSRGRYPYQIVPRFSRLRKILDPEERGEKAKAEKAKERKASFKEGLSKFGEQIGITVE